MRFHWLQDRVRQRQFCVQHVPGVLNLADYCCLSTSTLSLRPTLPPTPRTLSHRPYFLLLSLHDYSYSLLFFITLMIIASGCIDMVIILLPLYQYHHAKAL
jgi:hypothetical protein